jgi:hypothetical protein
MKLSEAERQKRKEANAAFTQTLRAYWDYELKRPIPDRLRELAAKADEALARSAAVP